MQSLKSEQFELMEFDDISDGQQGQHLMDQDFIIGSDM